MGITTVLENEDGIELGSVEDPTNVLHRVLPKVGEEHYQCLCDIDWYGDTVFNHIQAPKLLAEWDALARDGLDAEALRVIDGIRRLGERLRDERHTYLKFYGD